MKRLPLLVSLLAVVALSASLAYWALQLFKLPQRPLAAAPFQSVPEASLSAAAGLFGGQAVSAAISRYQLKGVVATANGRGSVAILVLDDKPAQALPVGAEVVAGVSVKEIRPRFVLLSESGVVKRVDLAIEVAQSGTPLSANLPTNLPVRPQPQTQPSKMSLEPTTAVPVPGMPPR